MVASRDLPTGGRAGLLNRQSDLPDCLESGTDASDQVGGVWNAESGRGKTFSAGETLFDRAELGRNDLTVDG